MRFLRRGYACRAFRRLRNALPFGGANATLRTTLSGLTSGEARPGDHALISADLPSGVTSWASQAWGTFYGDTTWGVAANPADYSAAEGQALFWQGIGDDGKTYTARAPIRAADALLFNGGDMFFDSDPLIFNAA